MKPSDVAFSTILFNFNNCRPEAVSHGISGVADKLVGMDVCANFGDSRFMPLEASFSVLFRTSLTSEPKYLVTSHLVWL